MNVLELINLSFNYPSSQHLVQEHFDLHLRQKSHNKKENAIKPTLGHHQNLHPTGTVNNAQPKKK